MNGSALAQARSIGMFAALALALGVSCSSTSQTTVIAAQGGAGDVGGSTSQAGGTGNEGIGGQTGSSTLGGNANCTTVPDLHAACIEDLGQGKLRLHYDFTNAEQGLDWSPSAEATVSIAQRALTVDAHNTIGVAIFKKKLHVDKASFSVILLSGNTTNWYINTIWSGSWNPDAGYGGYHDYSGRGFIINGVEYNPADVSPLAIGVMHKVTLEQSDSELTWDQDGVVMTETVGPLPVTDRILALGAWTSVAAFYDVVFEGTLDS